MRSSAFFNATSASTITNASTFCRLRRTIRGIAHGGVRLAACATLVLVATCPANPDDDMPEVNPMRRRRPQGIEFAGTTHPPSLSSWLEGARFLAWLEDGTPIEITGFAGDTVFTAEIDDTRGHQHLEALHPTMLLGMRWRETSCAGHACTTRSFRITAVTPDRSMNTMPHFGSNEDIWLYRVEQTSEPDPEPQDWSPVCSGTNLGLFADGRWTSGGTWAAGGYTFSCIEGAIAKCARTWGYKPWKTLQSPSQGLVDLRPLHLACIRAARADYCGDGRSHTENGTFIGMSDSYGFNPSEPDFDAIEATFDEKRALFVRHPRIVSKEPGCSPTAPASQDNPAFIRVWSR